MLTSCQERDSYFGHLAYEKKVAIALSDYGIEEVPPQIQELQNAEELTISWLSQDGWRVYPPLSFYSGLKEFPPPYQKLPKEITTLTKLRHLSIVDLNLSELPKDFTALENLETVNVALNKLNLSNELEKLQSLPHLRQLNVMGNRVDTVAMKKWMKEKPGLSISY